MTLKERFEYVVNWFERNNPAAETELHYRNPYELIVAVILSAQCTDKRVNLVTPELFRRFPEAESLAASSPEEVFQYIKSISYPNNKAKHLVGMAKMLLQDFGGVVPSEVDQLVKLPGVGRKTANLVVAVAYNKPAIRLDTHFHRIMNIWRYVKTPSPPVRSTTLSHHWRNTS